MTKWTTRAWATCLLMVCASAAPATTTHAADEPAMPFGKEFPNLDSLATGQWWAKTAKGPNPPPSMDVPRDEVIAFALYTHERGVLKLTAQLFPLKPDESRDVRLEIRRGDEWVEAAKAQIVYPGWDAHFRLEKWDDTKDVAYRVRHGERATFEGLIRRDPRDKDVIVIANMSCNSSRTTGLRPEIIDNLKAQNPDLLFFAGDQTYRHTEHTAGWIEFGLQFRDVLRDRPAVTIPDDHDVGHPNLWGEGGKRSTRRDNSDGGYFYPVEYVNMVQRQQTWHLPDAVDPRPVARGITVYFTRLRVGGVDFAILEDRKFKSGPQGKIPQMGPRPDHINKPGYDPKTIDVPGLELLGERQLKFLRDWGQDWTGADMKVVLSQTAFCGAVHLHGSTDNRLLADLDCNGWPQTGRNRALEEIRRAHATHLCGDQHLAVVVKHGIDAWGDGPYAFTSPALVNTIYGRWWHPEDEKAGTNPVANSPLPWTGDFRDGLGNKISLLAYANPADVRDERQRGDGYGVVRFHKKSGEITFECWPRFAKAADGDKAQYPGWPMTIRTADNDGRKPAAWLPKLNIRGVDRPVVQVVDEKSGDILYTIRAPGPTFQPHVFAAGTYTVKVGRDKPDGVVLAGIEAAIEKTAAGKKDVSVRSAADEKSQSNAADAPQHVIVCRDAGAGGYEAFPDVCRLSDGRLMTVFYAGYGHVALPSEKLPRGGRIAYCTSSDEGRTWSAAETLYDGPDDDRDPSIVQLGNGTLICNFFSLRKLDPPPQGKKWKGLGTWIVASEDLGKTWSPPKQISADHYCSSPIRELSTGRLILGLYGEADDSAHGATIHSDDGGKTWSKETAIDNAGIRLDAETDVIELADGSLFAAQRPAMCSSISKDGGLSWSKSEKIGFAGHCPYLLRTKDNIILLGTRLPQTSLRYSTDECRTWSDSVLVDDFIGAYPSMVNLRDGTVLIVYYEEGTGSNIRAKRLRATKQGIEWLPLD